MNEMTRQQRRASKRESGKSSAKTDERAIFETLVLIGVSREEMRLGYWSDIDLDNGTFTFPSLSDLKRRDPKFSPDDDARILTCVICSAKNEIIGDTFKTRALIDCYKCQNCVGFVV